LKPSALYSGSVLFEFETEIHVAYEAASVEYIRQEDEPYDSLVVLIPNSIHDHVNSFVSKYFLIFKVAEHFKQLCDSSFLF